VLETATPLPVKEEARAVLECPKSGRAKDNTQKDIAQMIYSELYC